MTTPLENTIQVVEEDWFAVDLESKLNKKIDTLQTLVNQQSEMIQQLSSDINQLKSELHSTRHHSELQNNHTYQQSEILQHVSNEIKQLKSELHSTRHLSASQNDRTHQLLEELKVLKQRELNLALREKIPIPFFPIPSSIFNKNGNLSPLHKNFKQNTSL
jgi:methyl-accepting chemotaxis protein